MMFNDNHKNLPIDPEEVYSERSDRDWAGIIITVICIAAAVYFGGHMVFWYTEGCPMRVSVSEVVYQCENVK